MVYGTTAEFDKDLPSVGVDRLGMDGLTLGTPSPSGAVTVDSANNSGIDSFEPQEYADSPEIERAEQCTVTHRFIMSWQDGLAYSDTYPRGSVFADSNGDLYKVLSSKIQSKAGGLCDLTVISEAITFDNPPDEFSLTTVSLNIDILKHPRYFFALNPSGDNSTTTTTIDGNVLTINISSVLQSIIRAVQTYRDSPFFPSKNNLNGLVQNNVLAQIYGDSIDVNYPNESFDPNDDEVEPIKLTDSNYTDSVAKNCRYFVIPVPTTDPAIDLATAAALEIISKIWRCEDTPYIAGYQITWSQYFYLPQKLNPGGYIENPFDDGNGNKNGQFPDLPDYVAEPSLPDYFYSTASPPDSSQTIFDDLPIYNAACYSSDGTQDGNYSISWLRQADTIEYERTWYKVTSTWIGSPVGHWDYDIYGGDTIRPTTTEEYNTVV